MHEAAVRAVRGGAEMVAAALTRRLYAEESLHLTVTREMGCQANAFQDEGHLMTHLDYDCSVVFLNSVSSIGR